MSVQCAEQLPFDIEGEMTLGDLKEAGALVGDLSFLCGRVIAVPETTEELSVDSLDVDPDTVVVSWRVVEISPAGHLYPAPIAKAT